MTLPTLLRSLLLVLLSTGAAARAAHDHAGHAHHDHSGHGHDTSGWELGLSLGYIHLEHEDAPGLHFHLSRRLAKEGSLQRVALGLGGEFIFDEEDHMAVMAPLSVYPWRGLVLSVAPGITWANHEGERESSFTLHFEAAYVFEVGKYDIGPVVEYATDEEDSHYMAGLHLGIHF